MQFPCVSSEKTSLISAIGPELMDCLRYYLSINECPVSIKFPFSWLRSVTCRGKPKPTSSSAARIRKDNSEANANKCSKNLLHLTAFYAMMDTNKCSDEAGSWKAV